MILIYFFWKKNLIFSHFFKLSHNLKLTSAFCIEISTKKRAITLISGCWRQKQKHEMEVKPICLYTAWIIPGTLFLDISLTKCTMRPLSIWIQILSFSGSTYHKISRRGTFNDYMDMILSFFDHLQWLTIAIFFGADLVWLTSMNIDPKFHAYLIY